MNIQPVILTHKDGSMEFEIDAPILKVLQICAQNGLKVRIRGDSDWRLPEWFEIHSKPDGIIDEGSGCEGVQCENNR